MISIIGAGPIGSYTAYLLAKENQEVHLFEDHHEIGKPVQCTGIVTNSIKNIIPIERKFLVNKINKVKVFSPNKKNIEFKLKNPNLIIDRTKFDQYLADKAEKAGARLHTNYKFIDFKKPYVIFNDRKPFKTDILIGADGPLSRVAKVSGLYGKREFVIGLQARINSSFEKNLVKFYLNENYFGWVVPESRDIGRVGIAAKSNAKDHFNSFLKLIGKKYKTKEYQSGLMPVYDPSINTFKDNIYLVGDAATMVKPTTYGGIVQGLMAAEELSKAIISNLDYNSLWRARIGKELRYGLMIRKVMDNFSQKDYNELLELLNKSNVKRVISNIDRDFPSKILFNIALKQPKLLKFIKNLY
ncbi:MAG: NAD(P)/FAD-dependent oxidoreductase [Nanoarchaeota archaeon]|nr:NAD(P)/FAD-dependent oxidoreductase [Nanoarchaeota archaeon]MBU0962564.1 NAD(P)/FAD-dependent oxidoreductase [Nanoarchaeota archaeon]